MSTPMQRSRQERALAQRQRELAKYSEAKELLHDGTLRNFTTPEDKAAKAQRDVDALTSKLGIHG